MDAESLLIRTHCVTLVRIYLNVCTARTSTITLTCVLHRWLGCQELGDTLSAMLRGTVHDVAANVHQALCTVSTMWHAHWSLTMSPSYVSSWPRYNWIKFSRLCRLLSAYLGSRRSSPSHTKSHRNWALGRAGPRDK